MNKKATINYVSPCGIYCIACPKYEDQSACRVCRVDSRHNNCDIYDCCVSMGGMDFCFECDCFPCERLKEFVNFNSGKSFAHFRHVAIENLNRIKEVGLETFVKEISQKALCGEYVIMKKNADGKLDTSQCPCVDKIK